MIEWSQGGKPFDWDVIILRWLHGMVFAVNFFTPNKYQVKKPQIRTGADWDAIPWGIDIELSINGQVPVKENKKHVPLVCNVQ